MSLSTAPILKNSHILANICFIFLKKSPKTNIIPDLTTVKGSKKQLPSKAKFSPFLQFLVAGLIVTKIVREIKFEGDLGRVRSKKLFPEKIIRNIFETISSFHAK